MTDKGWIKLHRSESVGLLKLTDQERCYYLAARIAAVWDRRNKLFGTFDCRTRIVKEEMLPAWAGGKINEVKRALLAKGYFRKTDDFRRLRITNIEILHGKSSNCDNLIQENEQNIHSIEIDIHVVEKRELDIRKSVAKLARDKSIYSEKYSPG